MTNLKDKVPPWIKDNLHFEPLKPVIRGAIVFWVSSIFLLDNTTLAWVGQATFFMLILSLLVPATDSPIGFLFSILLAMFGQLFGWAWGCAAMAAATAARNKVYLSFSSTS